ncbi:hypothetical protein [Ellagibacter isourolithinifaciens]|uniref:hypothetical protein n=1 Tax=Ellagibacter isourolithinifaciens TaxID=2137581 RepID=UPI001478D838|nr:hypothetical protein [Ellagibacter isourolithinifaciens]
MARRRVCSTAVVTAIGCDEGGWRHVLGLSVVAYYADFATPFHVPLLHRSAVG